MLAIQSDPIVKKVIDWDWNWKDKNQGLVISELDAKHRKIANENLFLGKVYVHKDVTIDERVFLNNKVYKPTVSSNSNNIDIGHYSKGIEQDGLLSGNDTKNKDVNLTNRSILETSEIEKKPSLMDEDDLNKKAKKGCLIF